MTSLINKKNFRFDLNGRSPAFFLKNKSINIDYRLIKDLINYSRNNKGINCRICLHKNKNANIHSMIVLINKKNFSKIHKHKNSDEIYNFIKGSFYVILYKSKKLQKKILISKKKNLIYKVNKGTVHNIKPIDKFIVFHEIKKNPYKK